MNPPKAVLVRSPNWIGDQILAYPFFHYLRRAYPSARIVAACVPWVQSVQFRDLVDEVLVLPRPLRPGLGEKFRALEEGAALARARGPFDLGIALPGSFSSAWVLWRAGARRRVGYAGDGRRLLLNDARDATSAARAHRAQAYVSLLPEPPARSAVEFWGVHPENELDPGIPGELSRFDAARAWPDAEPEAPPPGSYWVLAPGSAAESRRWPAGAFASLAREIVGETGWPGLIVGGPAEAPLAHELRADSSIRLLDFTARGPVSCYWRIFAGAKFTVANDSGLAHVASLCGSPTQVVWGGGDPKRTEPIGPGKVRIAFNPVDCWPCERNSCAQPPGLRLRCLAGIQPDAVWGEIKRGLRPA